MRKTAPKPQRAKLLLLRREERELAAKTVALTERLERLVSRLDAIDPAEFSRLKELAADAAALTERAGRPDSGLPGMDFAELSRLKRQLDLVLQIFERLGPESVDGKPDRA